MGKIRVKTLGDEGSEQEEQKKLKEKREQKNLEKKSHLKNMGGGQRINTVGPSEEEIMASHESQTEETNQTDSAPAGKGKKAKFIKKKTFSKRYKENKSLVDKNTVYPLKNSIEILKKFKKGNFDETVELHINVKEKGISGQVVLPHGTGKEVRIKIADEATIQAVEKGKIDFDVLIATPQMMPMLAKVARILGPRGLMPNPKTGTITDKPEALVEKLSKGQISFKTEAQAPVIHLTVGKVSFEDNKLLDNVKTVITSIGSSKIDKIFLKSTMSPAIRILLGK